MTGAGPRWAAFESTWPRRPGELADVLASALKPHGDAELLLVDLAFADGRFVSELTNCRNEKECERRGVPWGSSSSTGNCGGAGCGRASFRAALLDGGGRPARLGCWGQVRGLVAAW